MHRISWYELTRMKLYEVTIDQLYRSTLRAFPKTSKRQNSIDMINIESMDWVPYVGMMTLLISSTVRGEGFRNPTERKAQTYKTLIVFKNVQYESSSNPHNIGLMTKNGDAIYLRPINHLKKDVLVRCACTDFKFRFAPYNKESKALYGRFTPYIRKTDTWPSVNPTQAPGVCKHLIKLAHAVKDSGILSHVHT